MADIQKFLDKAGVSTLWSRIADELATQTESINAVKTTADTNKADITTMKGQIEALEAGTYDDSEIRGLISGNADAIQANTDALSVLNGTGDGSVTSTVAAEVAKVVAGADESYDTLKEIADWIINDTTGSVEMANDIASLKTLVGSTAVATQIADAIDTALKVDGVDKYALAADLTSLANRLEVLEAAKHVHENEEALNQVTNEKITAWDSAEANAKAYAYSIMPVALTEEEIDAAIAAAKETA